MQSKGSKSMIMILAVFAAMFFGYMSFFNGGDQAATEEGAALEAEQSGAGQEVIAVLNRLEGIRMDSALFSTKEFRSLVDQTVVVVDQPVGRNNPFAPVGRDGSFSPSTNAVTAAGTTTAPQAPRSGSVRAN